MGRGRRGTQGEGLPNRSNPSVFEITPGTYDLEAQSVEMTGVVRLRREGVTVEPEGSAEVAFEFASGTLRIGATRAGELLDVTVNVVDIATGQSVGSGRTYAEPRTNPKEFILAPGTYRLDLKARDGAQRTFEVVIEPGGSVEEMVEI